MRFVSPLIAVTDMECSKACNKQKNVMSKSISVVTEHVFRNITATEKMMNWKNTRWRYTVSGNGDKFVLAILSNTTGHLLALPVAEEFRDTFTTIALSVPPMKSFAETAEGLKLLLEREGVSVCNAIGHSNGGVYLQNLIARYPGLVDKIVFSHSLTSMNREDADTTNASEVKMYRLMRRILRILPASILTFAMGRIVLTKLCLQSGEADTRRLTALCRDDMKRITKQDLITIAGCMEDFLFNHTFTSEPYISAPHKVLIIDSPTDKIANPMQRAQMLKLCPGAQEYHFQSGGHITLVNCKNEYLSVLRRFWS
jgi:pimeloyl-ACP methyl ester carboxylesterase